MRTTLSPRRASRNRTLGFSLVELLVVIAVAVALMAITIPFHQDHDRVANEARRFLSDALRLRASARTTWSATVLTVDVAGRRWKCENASGNPIPGPDADPNGWRELTDTDVDFQAGAGSTTFVFLPNGRLQQDSAIQFVAGDVIWQISGNSLSGKITSARIQ